MIYHKTIVLKSRDSGLIIKYSKFCVIEIKISIRYLNKLNFGNVKTIMSQPPTQPVYQLD